MEEDARVSDECGVELREAFENMGIPKVSPEELMVHVGAEMQRRKRKRKTVLGVSMVAIVMVIAGVVSVQLVRATLPDIPVTTSPGKTGAVTSGQSLSCVEAYGSKELARRDWAADVTIRDIEIAGPDAEVILGVNQWFRGGQTKEVKVSMSSPWIDEDMPPAYGIGTRLLVSGSHDGHYRAWPCGFSRYYSEKTADKWAKVFE